MLLCRRVVLFLQIIHLIELATENYRVQESRAIRITATIRPRTLLCPYISR